MTAREHGVKVYLTCCRRCWAGCHEEAKEEVVTSPSRADGTDAHSEEG